MQELLVDTYFWSVIVALVLFFVGALSTGIWAAIRSWWSNHYEVSQSMGRQLRWQSRDTNC